jgi:Ca2+-transporting ATPase
MITGDHPRTARAIAAQAGIDDEERADRRGLAAMDAASFAREVTACASSRASARSRSWTSSRR